MRFKTWKFWLNAVALTALLLIIFLARRQVVDALIKLLDINLYWLVLIIPTQLVSYYAVSRFYQGYLKSIQENLSLPILYRISLEMNFINNVLPSGGVSGFGYLGLRLRKLGIAASKSTLVQLNRHALTFLGFLLYLFLAMFMLVIFGSANRFSVLIATSIFFLVFFGALVFVYIVGSQSRIKSFTAFLPKLINKLLKAFHISKREAISIERVERLFENLHKDYVEVSRNWRNLRAPFLWISLMIFMELMTIYVVYLAFGYTINPGALILGYAVANIAGLFSILPGGVGMYEALMTGTLASTGVPQALALSATVLYRVLNMLIFLPIGYIFYNHALSETSSESAEEAAEHEPADSKP